MKAVILNRYSKINDGLTIQEWTRPQPKATDVLIRVRACALNPVDLATKVGESKMMLPSRPPFLVGSDLAGEIIEVGTNVTTFTVGDHVIAYRSVATMGAFAQEVVVPAAHIAPKPQGLSWTEAAALPLTGLCAFQCLEAGKVGPHSRILVHGGAGGVGSMAVQLAKYRGAHIATTANAHQFEQLEEWGADQIINYKTQSFEKEVSQLDMVLDTVGGDTLARSYQVLKPSGTLASLHLIPTAPKLQQLGMKINGLFKMLLPIMSLGPNRKAKRHGVQLHPQVTLPNGQQLQQVAAIASEGALKPPAGLTFPLEEIHTAYDALAARKGKITLTMD